MSALRGDQLDRVLFGWADDRGRRLQRLRWGRALVEADRRPSRCSRATVVAWLADSQARGGLAR